MIGIDLIVNHIDTTDKPDLAINDRELAVHASQTLSAPQKRAVLGTKNLDSHARSLQMLAYRRIKRGAAKPVNDQMDRNSPASRRSHGAGNLPATRVGLKQIGFQKDRVLCHHHRALKRREILGPVLQQGDFIASHQAWSQGRCPMRRMRSQIAHRLRRALGLALRGPHQRPKIGH